MKTRGPIGHEALFLSNMAPSDTLRGSEIARWMDNRRIEWQYRLRAYEMAIMSCYYALLLGMRPWISMALLYAWTQLISYGYSTLYLLALIPYRYTLNGQLHLFSSLGFLFFAHATIDYYVLSGKLTPDSVSSFIHRWMDVSAQDVVQKSGYEPLSFEGICHAIALVEFQYLKWSDWASLIRERNPRAFVGLAFSVYVGITLVNWFVSDRTLFYIAVVGPLFVPALHHYRVMPRVFTVLEPFTRSTNAQNMVHTRGLRFLQPYLQPYLQPAATHISRWLDKYRERSSIPEDFWQRSPTATLQRDLHVRRPSNQSAHSVNTLHAVLDESPTRDPQPSFFSTSYWFGSNTALSSEPSSTNTTSVRPLPKLPDLPPENPAGFPISDSVSTSSKPYDISGNLHRRKGGEGTSPFASTSEDFDLIETEEAKKTS